MVSHSPEVATEHADRVLLLDAVSQTVVWADREELLDQNEVIARIIDEELRPGQNKVYLPGILKID